LDLGLIENVRKLSLQNSLPSLIISFSSTNDDGGIKRKKRLSEEDKSSKDRKSKKSIPPITYNISLGSAPQQTKVELQPREEPEEKDFIHDIDSDGKILGEKERNSPRDSNGRRMG